MASCLRTRLAQASSPLVSGAFCAPSSSASPWPSSSSSSSSSSSTSKSFAAHRSTPHHRHFSSSPVANAKPRRSQGDDDNPITLQNMEVFNYDDVPSIGHHIFNRQREFLKYHRIVHHEFPELEKLRQPYNPPPSSNFLRFRSMHYQGRSHPVTRKSVLVVPVSKVFEETPAFQKLQGEDAQRAKRRFLHLAGPRWDPRPLAPEATIEGSLNSKGRQGEPDFDPRTIEPMRLDGNYLSNTPSNGSLKISCERFPTERQNMKWCSDVVDSLIREAVSKEGKNDGIAEMPLDVRHAIAQDAKRAKGQRARARKASIRDWPKEWSTPKSA